jgi:hypothetical protein
MFRLFKKKEVIPVLEVYDDYMSVLKNINQNLLMSDNVAQSKFIESLIDLLRNKNIVDFVKLINGIDMWGGAGAVWEVYIENEEEQKKFEKEILSLIRLMKLTDIMGSGIKPIEKILIKNYK